MANAIDTGNPVKPKFIVNKYDDIGGSRVSQSTPRGAFCFLDTTGKMTLPRTAAEANKAVTPVDWAKPLNPGPYFNNANGLNGSPLEPFSNGSLETSETTFTMDPDVAYNVDWPGSFVVYEVPPLFYNLPVPSGAKCLVYNGEAVVTYGSGQYVGLVTDFAIGAKVYASVESGKNGLATVTASGATVAVGIVVGRGDFGDSTITIETRGKSAI
jgi:hypothetical protein